MQSYSVQNLAIKYRDVNGGNLWEFKALSSVNYEELIFRYYKKARRLT